MWWNFICLVKWCKNQRKMPHIIIFNSTGINFKKAKEWLFVFLFLKNISLKRCFSYKYLKITGESKGPSNPCFLFRTNESISYCFSKKAINCCKEDQVSCRFVIRIWFIIFPQCVLFCFVFLIEFLMLLIFFLFFTLHQDSANLQQQQQLYC